MAQCLIEILLLLIPVLTITKTLLFIKMHIIKLNITGEQVGSEEFFEFADYYFQSLYGSRQIINEEWQYEPIDDGLSINLFCPEEDSYMKKNTTVYGIQWKKRIEEELKCRFSFNCIGIDPEFGKTDIPKKRDFLILKTETCSPLLEGESLDQIPLYKLPYTYHDGECYNDINFWESNYKRIEGLWYNGAVGERWAQSQLQNYDSELSKQGIDCCKKIEEVTGVPTYYFLFNHRAWGQKKDKERKCPSCGNDWILTDSTFNDFYAFKCDDCRLISELSSNK